MSILVSAGLMLAAPLGAQVIYKWVDANGQQHFSDVPQEGAQELFIAPPQRYAPTVTSRSVQAATVTKDSDSQQQQSSGGYTSFAITSPGAEETIWNTGGTISVSLALQPALLTTHSIRILMNGQQKAQLPPGTTSAQLADVYRGTHQLTAQVISADGQILASSPAVTFYYKQTSVNRRPGGG